MEGTKDPGPRGGESSELADLLACELELGEMLAHAKEEARRLVEEARATADRADAELEASLEAESEGVRARMRQETQASVRVISARARERVAVLESVTDERVERLAEAAFRRLIGAEDRT